MTKEINQYKLGLFIVWLSICIGVIILIFSYLDSHYSYHPDKECLEKVAVKLCNSYNETYYYFNNYYFYCNNTIYNPHKAIGMTTDEKEFNTYKFLPEELEGCEKQ